MPPESDGRWQDILLWTDKVLTANQTDQSVWVPTNGANRILPSGVWVNASAPIQITCGIFGANDEENPVQISTFNLNSIGAWWGTSIPAIDWKWALLRMLNGNGISLLGLVRFRLAFS
jgi:hypothetical protein